MQHPDKGGDADLFGRLQRSFEVLSDPKKRAVYDTWAKELQFRYVRGVAAKVRVHYNLVPLNIKSVLSVRSLFCEPFCVYGEAHSRIASPYGTICRIKQCYWYSNKRACASPRIKMKYLKTFEPKLFVPQTLRFCCMALVLKCTC